MKKIFLFLMFSVFLIIIIQGCRKHESPTAVYPPTSTYTITATPTITPTRTPLPAIVVIDDFEDNNLINNINVPDNEWTCWGQIAGPNTCPHIINTAGGAVYGSYALKTTVTAVAASNSGTYWWTTRSLAWAVMQTSNNADGNGLNLSGHNFMSFAVSININPKPVTGTYTFDIKIYRQIESDSVTTQYSAKYVFTPADMDGTWSIVTIPLSSFIPAAGTADLNTVLTDVMFMTWNVYYQAPNQNDTADFDFRLDDVKFTR